MYTRTLEITLLNYLVESNFGCKDSVSQTIEIKSSPVAGFDIILLLVLDIILGFLTLLYILQFFQF